MLRVFNDTARYVDQVLPCSNPGADVQHINKLQPCA